MITLGWRRRRRPAGAFGGHGATRSQRMVRRATGHAQRLRALGDPPPSGGGWHNAFGCTSVHVRVRCGQRSCGRGAEGTGATPTGLSEVGSDWRQDRWHGQPGQRETVPTGSRPGNRCRVRNAASPATPQGETGDVNRSRRRLTPDNRPVVDLSTEAAPEGAQAKARSADRGAFVFPPPPPCPTPPHGPNLQNLRKITPALR